MGKHKITIELGDTSYKVYLKGALEHGKDVEELVQDLVSSQYPLLFNLSKKGHLLLYREGKWIPVDLEEGIHKSICKNDSLYDEQSILSVLEES